MRFVLDQPILAIGFMLKYPHGGTSNFGAISAYIPWRDTLLEMSIIKLNCVEHHRVPGEWDDEVKYDGFIFKNDEGVRYMNQYPRASYGQTSDAADNILQREFDKNDFDRDKIYRYKGMKRYLEELCHGIHEVEKDGTSEQVAMLKQLYKDVVEKIEKEFNVKVTKKPHCYGDDNKELPGFFDITVTFA